MEAALVPGLLAFDFMTARMKVCNKLLTQHVNNEHARWEETRGCDDKEVSNAHVTKFRFRFWFWLEDLLQVSHCSCSAPRGE